MNDMIVDASDRFYFSRFNGTPEALTTDIIKGMFAEVVAEPNYGLLEHSEYLGSTYVSEAYLFSQQCINSLRGMGITSVYFMKIYKFGSLRDLLSSIDSVVNLARAGLVSSLDFTLKVAPNDNEIFSANCDTLTDIPNNIVSEVLSAILSTNPQMDKEFLLDSVNVLIQAHMPCIDLKPIGVDLNDPERDFQFIENEFEYLASVINGYSFKFSGSTPSYPSPLNIT